MLKRILTAALLAGALSGLFVSALQAFSTTPLILEAETYEGAVDGTAEGSVEGPRHQSQTAETEMGTGPKARVFSTLLANLITASGFSLLLCAAFALREGARGSLGLKEGALWGLAGFAVFHLAPALGLPPELPGSFSAPLLERQAWWLLTILASAGGMGFLVFHPKMTFKGGGLLLILLPHLIGAPAPETHGGMVPAGLARQFVLLSLLSAAAFWLALGTLTAFFFSRPGKK